jgi:phosphoglycolate phosphatase
MAGLNLAWKAVLWDKDGTLVESFPSWIRLEKKLSLSLAQRAGYGGEVAAAYAARVLESLGVDGQGRVSAQGLLATGPVEAIFRAFWKSWKEVLSPDPLPFEAFTLDAQTLLDELLRRDPVLATPLPGAREALKTLADWGLIQGVATADTLTNTQLDLNSAELAPWVDFYACGDTVLRTKPDPWSVTAFAEFAQVQPCEVVVVGDTPTDAQMATRAGAAFFAVMCGSGRAEDFSTGTLILENPYGLIERLQDSPRRRT